MDLYALMGHPIQHSWSPQIHQLFAQQTQQLLAYQPILVSIDGFAQALDAFQREGGKGLNITLPFKQQAYESVGILTPRALRAKAVNTIRINLDGSLFGDNTDGVGFVRDVMVRHQFSLLNKRVLIIGAGGAARGIMDPILQENPELLVIANRTIEHALALAAEFSDYSFVKACPLSQLPQSQFDLIINGTSASLLDSNINLHLPDNILSQKAYCYDMVYGRGDTAFMQWAHKNKAERVSDGLGMLIEQAAESFYIWRGVRPRTEEIFNYFASSYQ